MSDSDSILSNVYSCSMEMILMTVPLNKNIHLIICFFFLSLSKYLLIYITFRKLFKFKLKLRKPIKIMCFFRGVR